MSKLKKVLLMCTAYVLVAALAIGGTIAYLQDSDSDVNVMTLGNVSIAQHEYQRAEGVAHDAGEPGAGNGVKEGALVEFVQNQKLYPAVPKNGAATDYTAEMDTANLFFWGDYVYSGTAGNGLWNDNKLSNVMDKMVFVENTGKTDAYIRTVIAFECPEGITIGEPSQGAEIMINTNIGTYDWEDVGYITVDGVRYAVMTATYKKVLAPGNQSHPSLLQVVMTHHATNEDMELLGDTYEILVLSQAVQTAGFANAATALDTAFGDDNTENAAKWFKGVIDKQPDTWDGTVDTSWYNDTDTEFTLTTAEQLAGLAELVDGGKTFTSKTVKLGKNLDLYAEDANGEPISFEPIGSFSDDKAFEGTFDGQGHTISNLYQNGWALANGYWDGPEYGMGLFSLVENATVKNLNFDGADLPTEANIIGVVAGGAANCVFENINITGAYLGNHSWYSGGAIGWAEGDVKLINCDIDATSVVSSQWGDFNNANGGLIGGIDGTSTIYLKDCDVACVIDAYNDVTSAYEWYSYRNCGMLIGDTAQKDDPDGDNVGDAIAPNLTCENVTVTYGTWANYHYCEFGSAGYPFCRVEAGESTGAYGNARVGEYTDANGNKVVDDNHTHNTGEKHNELIVFDQLYGGASGDRYCTYGTATHPGVTVIYNNK